MQMDFVKPSVWIVNKYRGVLFKAGLRAVQQKKNIHLCRRYSPLARRAQLRVMEISMYLLRIQSEDLNFWRRNYFFFNFSTSCI